MMKCRRRALKWLATIACIMVLLAWAASFSWFYGCAIRLGSHQLVTNTIPNQFGLALERGSIYPQTFHAIEVPRVQIESWGIDRVRVGSPLGPTADFLYIAFWIPALLLGAPAAWLWFVDRRCNRNGCPTCGYDLRGDAPNGCPECGWNRPSA
jgi:hypothetical protein